MGFGRQGQDQEGHYLRLTVTYANANVAIPFRAQLPAGALVTSVFCSVSTVFNAGTTNNVTVGTNAATYNNIVASGTFTPGTIGNVNYPNTGTTAPTPATFAVDTLPYVLVTTTGTAPTAGVMTIVIHYIPNNDG